VLVPGASWDQLLAGQRLDDDGSGRWRVQVGLPAVDGEEMMASMPGLAARIKVVAVRTGTPMAAWRWMVA
jgi:hypothetical protein